MNQAKHNYNHKNSLVKQDSKNSNSSGGTYDTDTDSSDSNDSDDSSSSNSSSSSSGSSNSSMSSNSTESSIDPRDYNKYNKGQVQVYQSKPIQHNQPSMQQTFNNNQKFNTQPYVINYPLNTNFNNQTIQNPFIAQPREVYYPSNFELYEEPPVKPNSSKQEEFIVKHYHYQTGNQKQHQPIQPYIQQHREDTTIEIVELEKKSARSNYVTLPPVSTPVNKFTKTPQKEKPQETVKLPALNSSRSTPASKTVTIRRYDPTTRASFNKKITITDHM